MAPLVACHAIHGSSAALASALRDYNPLMVCIENGVETVPALQVEKHKSITKRVFIGNQNRRKEHDDLVNPLRQWLQEDTNIIAVIVGDSNIAEKINMPNRVEYYPILSYKEYRKVLKSCHIALMPLRKGEPERCKTVIKWAEASAESVAVVAGPELYSNVRTDGKGRTTCSIGVDIEDVVVKAKELTNNKKGILEQIESAYEWVDLEWNLKNLLPKRIELYNAIWKRRKKLDELVVKRLYESAPLLKEAPFLL